MQDYISEPTHRVKAKTHSPPHSEPHSFPNKGEHIKQRATTNRSSRNNRRAAQIDKRNLGPFTTIIDAGITSSLTTSPMSCTSCRRDQVKSMKTQ